MPLRSPAARIVLLVLSVLLAVPGLAAVSALAAVSGRAAEFTDSAGRRVVVPDQVGRIMAAGPSAAVMVFVLTPGKLIGWTEPLARAQRALLPAKFARLPVVGRLSGPYPTATAAEVLRLHPDLIIDCGVSPQSAALADRIQRQTGVPYIVLGNSIQLTPEVLRTLRALLGAGDRGLAIANYAYQAIEELRGKLLITSSTDRPRVYYGRGNDGLETGLAGSDAMSDIDQAGVINVAAGLGRGELTRVSRAQIIAWNPDIIIAQRRSFYDALRRDPAWGGLLAVANKRVYLAPSDPFGWIDDPAGVNRMVGLYWLSDLFYPDLYEQDLNTIVREFYQLYYGVQLNDRQMAALTGPAGAKPGEQRQLANVPLLGAEPPPLPNISPGAGMPGVPGAIPGVVPGRGGLRGGAPAGPPANQ